MPVARRVKAAVYSLTGEERGVTGAPVPPDHAPRPAMPNAIPEQLWAGLCTVIREAMQKANVTGNDIAAVGITGYGNGLYLVDADGKMIGNGILSSDQRAAPLVEEWRKTGIEPTYTKASYKPVWQARRYLCSPGSRNTGPRLSLRPKTVFTCKDYLRFRLTGARVGEVDDQSTATVLNTATRTSPNRSSSPFSASRSRPDCGRP